MGMASAEITYPVLEELLGIKGRAKIVSVATPVVGRMSTYVENQAIHVLLESSEFPEQQVVPTPEPLASPVAYPDVSLEYQEEQASGPRFVKFVLREVSA